MPVILLCAIIFSFWITYQRKKSDKSAKKTSEEFWEIERQSNFTRPKDLSNLDYITVDFENLPFSQTEDEEINYVQEQLYKLKGQRILNLTGQSNTELKLAYGNANLTQLSTYDQNYTLLIRNLNKWGQLLFSKGETQTAKQVLEYAISVDSDISQTFLTLAMIYSQENNSEALTRLRDKAMLLNSPLKDSLIQKLTTICEKVNHAQE